MSSMRTSYVATVIVIVLVATGLTSWLMHRAPPSETGVPVLIGWGGTRLMGTANANPANPTSEAFPGEKASDQEVQVRRLVQMGFNTIRVSFAPACSSQGAFMGKYNPTQLAKSIGLAKHYQFWIIIDYHGYNDTITEASSNCWVDFWHSVLAGFKDSYERIVWEPLNEPTGIGGNVTSLSIQYQRWIDQARSLGDAHWIVVQNLCSFGCKFNDLADGFPNVTDPLGKVFISIHPYMRFQTYASFWNDTTAESVAERYYNASIQGSLKTGWPVLLTEGGAAGGNITAAPDLVLPGAAGYTRTGFHFIQVLTSMLDSHKPQRVSWVWWPIGDWTTTPGAGVLGALAENGWGSLLNYQQIGSEKTSALSTSNVDGTTDRFYSEGSQVASAQVNSFRSNRSSPSAAVTAKYASIIATPSGTVALY